MAAYNDVYAERAEALKDAAYQAYRDLMEIHGQDGVALDYDDWLATL